MSSILSARVRRLSLLLPAFLVTACGSAMQPRLSTVPLPNLYRADQAGTASVAVLSVGRWEDYVDSLQPAFTLTEGKALDSVVATTRELEEKFVDALRLGVSVGLEETSTEETDTATRQDGQETSTSTRTTTRAPGEAPDTAPIATAAGDLGGDDSGLTGGVGTDSMSRHWAATALYQEVQLLNRYVRDAQQREGYRPYVVRLQVSLLPKARNLPYDAYTTFSFFGGPAWGSSQYSQSGAVTAGDRVTLRKLMADQRFTDEERNLLRGLQSDPRIVVVPLLVTDNLEATLHSQTIDVVRQFALAIGFLKGGDTGGVDFARSLERLESALGRDFNSLLTVARLSDNTVRVRLGALQQIATSHAMVPRTHNISLLVLVPCEVSCSSERLASLVHRTDYVHIFDGRRLKPMESDQLRKRLKRIADDFDIDKLPAHKASGCNVREHMVPLYEAAEAGDRKRFEDTLTACAGEDASFFTLQPLWLAMIDLAGQSQHGQATFGLPVPVDRRGFTAGQSVLLLDDTAKGLATVTLIGGSGLQASGLQATLNLQDKAKGPVQLAAEKVETVREGRDFRFTFPSPKAWSIDPVPLEGNLEVTYPPAPRNRHCGASGGSSCAENGRSDACDANDVAKCPRQFGPILYQSKSVQAKEEGPDFTMSIGASFIQQKDGKGSLVIHFKMSEKDPPDEVSFRVRNADVRSVTATKPSDGQSCHPTLANPNRASWQLTGDCDVRFELENLVQGTSVLLSAGSKKADSAAPGGHRKTEHPQVAVQVL